MSFDCGAEMNIKPIKFYRPFRCISLAFFCSFSGYANAQDLSSKDILGNWCVRDTNDSYIYQELHFLKKGKVKISDHERKNVELADWEILNGNQLKINYLDSTSEVILSANKLNSTRIQLINQSSGSETFLLSNSICHGLRKDHAFIQGNKISYSDLRNELMINLRYDVSNVKIRMSYHPMLNRYNPVGLLLSPLAFDTLLFELDYEHQVSCTISIRKPDDTRFSKSFHIGDCHSDTTEVQFRSGHFMIVPIEKVTNSEIN